MSAPRTLRVVYGGTFDPVHAGHLAIARAARDACQADIHLLPAADPPHRPPPGASAADRAAMVALAIEGVAGLVLDVRELERTGRSWTIDTLREVRAEAGPHTPIAWLLGADSFLALPQWKDWSVLFGLAHFIIAGRSGSRLDGRLAAELAHALRGRWASRVAALRDAPAGRVLRLRQPLQPESASDVRMCIAAGLPWREQVPAAVAAYIVGHGLYGTAGAGAVIGPQPAPSL